MSHHLDHHGHHEEPRSPEEDASARIVREFHERLERFRREVAKVIVGQDDVLHELLLALLCDGHALIEGVPGLAKTLLVRSVAAALDLQFGRIQFTPDLMPSDVTGSLVVQDDPILGRRFTFRRGPIFVNMLLADEINRTPPKTQAALLEGMGERQVTVAGTRHALAKPFFVLATQNPIEQEGTYPLPEAQLDRFLLSILIDYPSMDEEAEIIARTTGEHSAHVEPVVTRDEILELQRVVRAIPASQHILEYAARLVRATRPGGEGAPEWVQGLIAWGAGPRAVQALVLAAKANTILSGRFAVTRSDVRAVSYPVLRHRVLPSFRAEGEGLRPDDLITRLLLDVTPVPSRDRHDSVVRKILRL
jgi:MoxR-like ATPase